jgi:hypothetical protein
MGHRTDASIRDFQERAGFSPATGARAETLERISHLAYELIRAVELERSGIRDGDGQWHGTDAIASIVAEIVAAERADLHAWKKTRTLEVSGGGCKSVRRTRLEDRASPSNTRTTPRLKSERSI